MENSNRRIIKMLDSIPKFDTYSQYSNSLEKVFQDNSFHNLMKSLKEQKKPKIYSYFNVEEKKIDTNNIFKAYGIENKREDSKSNLLNDDNDKNIKDNNEKDEITTKKEAWKIPIIKTRRRYNPELDPFRYNPNYNSIYKNIPSVRITKPINETLPINNYKVKIKNKIQQKSEPSPFLTEIGDKSINSPFSTKNQRSKNFDLNNGDLRKFNKIKKIKKKSEENDRNNHSIRFDKYVDRKVDKIDINPYVSYIEPFDYLKTRNNTIDFNKMKGRTDENFLIMNNIKGPTIGYYNPNYDYFNPKMRNICFGDESKKEKNRMYSLKKLWSSYKVRLDYQLVDNNKLNKEILKDL